MNAANANSPITNNATSLTSSPFYYPAPVASAQPFEPSLDGRAFNPYILGSTESDPSAPFRFNGFSSPIQQLYGAMPIPVNPVYYYHSQPSESVDTAIATVEDELIRLHDEGRIGSLDMDHFSEQLLALKRNYEAMLSTTGSLSEKQETELKKEVSMLHDDINKQIVSN